MLSITASLLLSSVIMVGMNMSNDASKVYVLIAATLGAFVTPFMGSSINIAFPSIGKELEIGRVQITPEYHELFLRSVKVAFIIFACFCFGGIFASLARGRVR